MNEMDRELLVLDISDADLLEVKTYCQTVLEPNGYDIHLEYQGPKALLVAQRNNWMVKKRV